MLCLRVAVGVMLVSESESSKAGSGLARFSLNWVSIIFDADRPEEKI